LSNGTISYDPIDVPEEDMSTNLISQMINNQKEKRENKGLTGKWTKTGTGAGAGAGGSTSAGTGVGAGANQK
jgi:hypothetical protein